MTDQIDNYFYPVAFTARGVWIEIPDPSDDGESIIAVGGAGATVTPVAPGQGRVFVEYPHIARFNEALGKGMAYGN
jgi:hypothetical protein